MPKRVEAVFKAKGRTARYLLVMYELSNETKETQS